MSMLELQVRTQTAVTNAVTDLVERSKDEDGQTSIEYLGIVVVVGLMLAVILKAAPEFGESITSKIKDVISKMA